MAHAQGHTTSDSERRLGVWLGAAAAGALALEYVPSVVALGQWGPFGALPWALCTWQGPRFPARVALTFDDGPDPEGTPAVLDCADELGIKATFFVLGSRVERAPELVQEIVHRGHAVGVHGYEHARHLLRSPHWVRRDLGRAREVIASAGVDPLWYRPSYGQATAATLLAARGLGLRTVLWSAWGREWATPSSQGVADRISRRLRPGAIVLLHDSDRMGPAGMSRRALEALPDVARQLERRGLQPVTLDEMLR